MLKTCSHCLREKDASEFQMRALSKDGLTASCKSCLKERDKARYPKERKNRSALCKAYSKTENGKEKLRAARKRWIMRNKLKRAAHVAVGNAVRDGHLVRMPCEKCGKKAEAHHDDYRKPLSVRWLCRKHHLEHHGKIAY